MTIEILVCAPDGSQTLETREVPDDYFAVKEDAPVEQQQKTPNLALNQWQRSDPVVMDDFNADNAKLDAALGGMAVDRLLTVVTSAAANQVDLDLSGLDLTKYAQLHLAAGIITDNSTSGYCYCNMRANDIASGYFFSWSGQALTSSNTSIAQFETSNIGSICDAKMSMITWHLHCLSMSDFSASGYNNSYIPGSGSVALPTGKLTKISIFVQTTPYKIQAGTSFFLYGLKK